MGGDRSGKKPDYRRWKDNEGYCLAGNAYRRRKNATGWQSTIFISRSPKRRRAVCPMDKALTVFPYRQDARGLLFPIVPLRFHIGKTIIDSGALIDSGATVSIFKEDVAISLGLEIEKGKEIWLGGVGGHIKGYLHELKVEVAGKKFVCPIVFSREYLVSFNLLGRQEFFNRFKIVFEEEKNRLRLE